MLKGIGSLKREEKIGNYSSGKSEKIKACLLKVEPS